jgi:hypothetical protein
MHHEVSPMPDDWIDSEILPGHRRRRFGPEPGEVRCECQACSAHAFARPGVEGSGRCGNCGSEDLQPLSAPGRIRTDDLAVKSRSL